METWARVLLVSGIGIAVVVGLALLTTNSRGSPPANRVRRPVYSTRLHDPGEGIVKYRNRETWELVRGPDNRIQKVIIDRKVTEHG